MVKRKSRYAGKVLQVDLSRGSTTVEELPEETRYRFLGGPGLNAQRALELIPRGIDPLCSENTVLIAAGALTGTEAMGTPKTEIVSKSPHRQPSRSGQHQHGKPGCLRPRFMRQGHCLRGRFGRSCESRR